MEEQERVVKLNARAASMAWATTRSLKECVGLPESSLTKSFPGVTPSSRARLSAWTSLVQPGLMFGFSATSAGTGRSGAYRQMFAGPASMRLRRSSVS